jgi:hypothetical protein
MRLLLVACIVAACGGDEPAKPTVPPGAAGATAQPGQPAAGSGSGSAMPLANKVELLVSCPPPIENGEVCDPNIVPEVELDDEKQKPDPATDKICAPDQYCLPTKVGYLCGVCPERDTIRHAFKDRDFNVEFNRDPFSSDVVRPAGAGSGSGALPRDLTNRCASADQLRVQNYGYLDLRLVGIVRQGTQRKVLMMDPGNVGHIIKTSDCVGKERAFVKDIGDNFVCFEAMDPTGTRVLEPHCPELHNKSITPLSPDYVPPPRTPPTETPAVTPPTGGAGSQQAPGTQTPPTRTPTTQTPPPPTPPQQPPTNLKP